MFISSTYLRETSSVNDSLYSDREMLYNANFEENSAKSDAGISAFSNVYNCKIHILWTYKQAGVKGTVQRYGSCAIDVQLCIISLPVK